MATFLFWLLLLIVCWPVALLAVLIYPIMWLVMLPFRIVGVAMDGALELIRMAIFLPMRLIGRVVKSV